MIAAAPLSATPIAGGPLEFNFVTLALTTHAQTCWQFSGSASMQFSVEMDSPAPRPTIQFGGSASLERGFNPVEVSAVYEPFELVAVYEPMTLEAIFEPFTIRGRS